jgi:hypothetical protein
MVCGLLTISTLGHNDNKSEPETLAVIAYLGIRERFLGLVTPR